MSEVNLIIHVISLGIIIMLLLVIYKLARKISRMYERINAVDDYILTKFLTNERKKNRTDRRADNG